MDRGQGQPLTREELVLPEKVQVPVQVGEVVVQALPSRSPVEGHAMSGLDKVGPGLELWPHPSRWGIHKVPHGIRLQTQWAPPLGKHQLWKPSSHSQPSMN